MIEDQNEALLKPSAVTRRAMAILQQNLELVEYENRTRTSGFNPEHLYFRTDAELALFDLSFDEFAGHLAKSGIRVGHTLNICLPNKYTL